MNRWSAALLALALLGPASAGPVLAHEGHEHTVMGTVTAAAADRLVLRDRDGKEVAIRVTKDTRVKARPPVKAGAIKAGTRVVVTAVTEKDDSMTAKSIEVGRTVVR